MYLLIVLSKSICEKCGCSLFALYRHVPEFQKYSNKECIKNVIHSFHFKNEKAPSPPNVSSEWHEPVHHSYCHLPDHK